MAKWTSNNSTTSPGFMDVWSVPAKHCSLHKVADYLPLESNKASKIQRLERFLKNPGIVVKVIYMEIVKVMLEKWNSRSLDIAMDRTDWKIFNLLLYSIQ